MPTDTATDDSHYLPYFVSERWPTTACGLSTRFQTIDHSPEPTCPKCQAWLNADVKEAEAITE